MKKGTRMPFIPMKNNERNYVGVFTLKYMRFLIELFKLGVVDQINCFETLVKGF